MTIVCWDGKTLAADKRAVNHTYKGGTVTKIHRWEGGLCGFSGNFDVGIQLVHWLRSGADPDKYPELQEDSEASFLVIHRDGRTEYYERTPIPLPFENPIHAIGSGRDFALAALYLGKTAREAVEIAIALDYACGNGIDTLTLEAA